MAVMIDPPRWPAHGRLWSHLATDASLPELHALAARAGIPRRAFEGDHYDVPAERYDDLVRAGAVPVGGRELLRRLVAAGLRVPKRRGEHVLSSTTVHDHLPDAGPGRLDVVRSSLPLSSDAVHEHLLLDRDADGEVLLVRGQAGTWTLPPLSAAAGPTHPLGFVRHRLDGEPGPAYRYARPWTSRQVHLGPAGSGVQRAMRVPTDDAARLLGDDPVVLLLGQDRGVH